MYLYVQTIWICITVFKKNTKITNTHIWTQIHKLLYKVYTYDIIFNKTNKNITMWKYVMA